MASASDVFERIIYQLLFEEGFESDAIIQTSTCRLVLYNTIPNEDGSNAQEFGISIVASGYAAVVLSTGVGNDVFEPVAGKTGVWVNDLAIDFGTNGGATNWPLITGWGIKDTTLVAPDNIYLKGSFLDSLGAPTTFAVIPTQKFEIPVGAFVISID